MSIPCSACKTATKITRNTGVFTTADAGEWIRLDCPACRLVEWICERDWKRYKERQDAKKARQ